MRRHIIYITFLISIFVLTTPSFAALQKCTICHGKPGFKKVDEAGKVKILHVDDTILKKSVHAKRGCTDCHFDVTEIPHRVLPKRVKCTHCHYKGNPEGAPQSDTYLEYEESVHGKAVKEGKPKSPVCQECHGNHDIKHTEKPESHVSRANIGKTCGKCHLKEYADYMNSIHGQAVYAENNQDAPVCTNCHGEHNIISREEPESTVYPSKVSETCSKCHAVVTIMGKYGIEAEQVDTFDESFHGIAVKFGSKTVANCASCHGIHDILPPSNPQSSVHINNIPKTCGKCHPGANINYAKGKIHVDPKKKESGIIFYISQFFKWLTISVMIGLIIHIILDLNRKSKDFREKKKK